VELDGIKALIEGRQPGHSLPQALYNDPDVFRFDLDAIYARSWLMAGFECELPEPTSYLSLKIGAWPVLIVRDRGGALRAFHNSCRHRGAMLCKEGQGSNPRIVCPYHRWTYNLDGSLLSAQRMTDFDKADHGLRTVRIESVAGVLYICLSDDPPPFETFRREMEILLAPHHLADAKVAHSATLTEHANWKLVMENGRECYHCPTAHPELSKTFPIGTSAHFDYGDDRSPEIFRARMEELGLPAGPAEEDWWQAVRFPLNPGMKSMTMDGELAVAKLMCEPGAGDIGSMRWALEPHSFAHATGDFTFFFSALPIGPRETLVVAKWLVHKDAVEGVDYDLAQLTTLWDTTNWQDKELAENNQDGVDSYGYTPGPYSQDGEALVLRFVDWYCAKAQAYLAEKLDGPVADLRELLHVG